jgi:hypothetical protein
MPNLSILCLGGGIFLFCTLFFVFVIRAVCVRISDLEMKILADSLEFRSKVKEQIEGTIDFHLRNSISTSNKRLPTCFKKKKCV